MIDPRTVALWVAATLLTLAGPAHAGKRGKAQSDPEFYAMASPTVATVDFNQEFVSSGQRQQTTSSVDGVVISPDGLVLISGTVRFPQRGPGRLASGSLPELTGFRLHFADGREHSAEVVAFNADLNLGLLRITDGDPSVPFPHAVFADTYTPAIGDGLRSLTLYTEEYGREPVLSPVGLNAILKTPQDVWSLSGSTLNMLGAPLWNPRGQVVGVLAQVPMTPGGGRQVRPELSGPVGLAYARFSTWLDEARRDAGLPLLAPKEDDAGWLGIEFQAMERPLAKHLAISPGGGIIVTRVIAGSPAADAGIKPLDILVDLGGGRIAVNQESDLNRFVERVRVNPPGSVVRFTREARGGARDVVAVTLAQSPKTELQADRRRDDPFELTVREVTLDALLSQRLEPGVTGVIVDGVTGAGWAGLAGLSRGMIIQRVNAHDVTDLDSFTKALEAVRAERPTKVLFFVRFQKDTRFFVAEPDWKELSPQ